MQILQASRVLYAVFLQANPRFTDTRAVSAALHIGIGSVVRRDVVFGIRVYGRLARGRLLLTLYAGSGWDWGRVR